MNTISAPIPDQFVSIISTLLGPERARALCEALDTDPEVCVRLNRRKPTLAPLFDGEIAVPWCTDAYRLGTRPVFTLMPEMHSGAFYVQEAASTIYTWLGGHIAALTGHRPLRVLDLCAAPGGKTTALLNALPDGSVVMANEHSPQRVRVLAENLIKYGYPSVLVTRGDGRDIAAMTGMFDVVVVDAPCSGEGMMRREEVARTQWTPRLVEQCASLQRELLNAAVSALRPGGCLIYSTCTFNDTEDESNVRYAMERHGLVPELPEVPGGWELPGSLDPQISAIRFLPGETPTEGLFVSVLRRPGTLLPDPADFTLPAPPARRARGGKGAKGYDTAPGCTEWIDTDAIPGGVAWRVTDSGVSAVPAAVARLEEALPRSIRVVTAGVEVAVTKGRDLFPAPALALSTVLRRGVFPEVELSRDTAVRYLRCEAVAVGGEAPRGALLLCHNGVPMGWVKNLGNRANNLWPREWRIRMDDRNADV